MAIEYEEAFRRLKGLTFFKYTDLDLILSKLKLDRIPPEKRKCVVCKVPLTKDNIGALISDSAAVCKDFACIMAVLLKEKRW